MLIEIYSPVFIENGAIRSAIIFHEGLNVVLGEENGENSIGKSSTMLVIDFVFGGGTYVNSDGVKKKGHHTIFFGFEFDGVKYYFARNTESPEMIHVCKKSGDGDYNPIGIVKTKQEYADWLKEMYKIDFEGLSFRQTISSFFRIYGKENLDERRPLKGLPGQNMQKSIDVLVKLFNRFKDISEYNVKLEEQKKMLAAFREARRYRFVPDLVGGKTQYEENLSMISNLQIELDNLTEEQVAEHSEIDIEKSQMKSRLQAEQLNVETELQSAKRRLTLVDMSLEYGLYPTEIDLSELQEYFPTVNLRKIYEVEKYHKKLATILQDQFSNEKTAIQTDIETLEARLTRVKGDIQQLGFVGNFSKEFLDKHSEIKGRIDAIKAQNEAYLTLQDLTYQKQLTDARLKEAIEIILRDIEAELNDKMQELNDSLFSDARKAPHLYLNEYNSYRFETPDDTGTGSNYKGMVIYDLAIMQTTDLPAIAHDSLILKNISDVAINGIMRIYADSKKQIFIAFDKQTAYGDETYEILKSHKVLELYKGGGELYGESWNKEEV